MLEKAQSIIEALYHQSAKATPVSPFGRQKSNLMGDYASASTYPPTFLGPFGSAPYQPVSFLPMRRYESLNLSNNIATNIVNSNFITNVRVDRRTDLHPNQNSLPKLGSLPFGSMSHHIIPIDESNEKPNSKSSYRHSSSSFYDPSNASQLDSNNTKYSVIHFNNKNKPKKNKKHKPKNGGRESFSSKQKGSSANFTENDNSIIPLEHISTREIALPDDSLIDTTLNPTTDILPFERSMTNRTVESNGSHRHHGLNKVESMAIPRKQQPEFCDEEPLLIVALFSEPLVYIRQKGCDQKQPEEYSPVDFEGELTEIANVFEGKGMNQVTFKIGSLNMENFRKTIENYPEIIHIMCHGDFDKESKKYYLDFENENAEVFPFYAKDIKKYLEENGLNNTVLVFLNACYSEQVASCFLDKDIKCIIAIEKHSKIDDRVSKHFAKTFYKYLFSNSTFQKAFDNTVSDLTTTYSRNQELYFSFCSHIHKEDCRWNENEHMELMQIMLKCGCPNKFRSLHKTSCLAVFSFQMEFWVGTDAESLGLEQEVVLCCCSRELPHEEILKFKIFYQQEHYKNMRLFDLLSQSRNRQRRCYFNEFDTMRIDKRYKNIASMGFNYYMYQLFNYFANDNGRVAIINGEYGSGKTTLIKHFANYSLFRNKFFYINGADFTQINSIEQLNSNVMKWLGKRNNFTKGRSSNKSRKVHRTLLFLDNLDTLISRNPERVKQEIQRIIQQDDVYFLISVSKNKSLNFPLENKEIVIKPLSYHVGAQLFLSKCRKALPSEYQNLESLIYYKDFERIQDFLVFYPYNIIQLATKITQPSLFKLEEMHKLVETMKARNLIEEANEDSRKKMNQIEDDIDDYHFLIFLGFLEHGVYFTEDLGTYLNKSSAPEMQKLIDFVLDDVVDRANLTPQLIEDANELRPDRFNHAAQTRESIIKNLTTLREMIIETRLKDTNRIEVRTVAIEKAHLRDNDFMLVIKTLDIKRFLKENFRRKVFKSFLFVLDFLICKANCLFSYFQDNYLIAEDTYFTAFRDLKFTPFFVDQRLQNLTQKKPILRHFIKTHLKNIKSILDDNQFISLFFKQIKNDEGVDQSSLQLFESLVKKFFTIAEMESLNENYFDIEIDFKNLVLILKMDYAISELLIPLYLELSLFSLNSMLKRTFLEKYSHDYFNRITSRISLIKSIFREPYARNHESRFKIHKFEFYYLKIRAFKKLNRNKKRVNQENQKLDPKSAELLAKLEKGVRVLVESRHCHLLFKVYLMLAKERYRANKIDIPTVSRLENCFDKLPERVNFNLALRVRLLLTMIYHDFQNFGHRDEQLNKAIAINQKIKSPIYEHRINRVIDTLYHLHQPPKMQIVVHVSTFFANSADLSIPQTDNSSTLGNEKDASAEIVTIERLEKSFANIMDNRSGGYANFMIHPLSPAWLYSSLFVNVHYKVFCLYFNTISDTYFYFESDTASGSSEAFTAKELFDILFSKKASIEILIILNPIQDRLLLNELCLIIPYTIYIEKFDLASLATPEAQGEIAHFILLNFVKQFVSRTVNDTQNTILQNFEESTDTLYKCLDNILPQDLIYSIDPSNPEPTEVTNDMLVEMFRANLKFKISWDNETPFFERLLQITDHSACIINISSYDDFGTKFRLKDQKNYPISDNDSCQKRMYKSCLEFDDNKQLNEWLLKTMQQCNRAKKRTKREQGKDAQCDLMNPSLQTIIIYDIPFQLDPFLSDALAKLLIRMRVTIIFLNTDELTMHSKYIIAEQEINLPRQDFNLMALDYGSEENILVGTSLLKKLARVMTESVFLSLDEGDSDRQSGLSFKRINLSKRISNDVGDDERNF